jgi:hypothetical protein
MLGRLIRPGQHRVQVVLFARKIPTTGTIYGHLQISDVF